MSNRLSSPLGSWLQDARARVTRRPRAALHRMVRREVRTQLDLRLPRARQEAIEGALEAPALHTMIDKTFARGWDELRPTLQPGATAINRDFTAEVFFGTGSRYDRTLVPARMQRLTEQIRTLAGCEDPSFAIQQAYRALLAAESIGLGRIAGSSYNIIGKLVVPPLLDPPPGPILEIGTLFGLFSPALVRQFRRLGQERHLTVIDPLEGVQLQPEMAVRPDPTGTPVTADVARHNLQHSGLAIDEFRIVQGFSTDPVAQTEVADRAYAVIVVDGDHSEDGVHADLWWAQEIAQPGAIVVMDDFGDPKWPGVERATRRYLAGGGRLELLGSAATSGYLRMPSD